MGNRVSWIILGGLSLREFSNEALENTGVNQTENIK
jgi:hypothetical protein